MKENIFPAIKLTLLFLIFFSGIYTLVIYGIAQFSPNGGNGEIVIYNNKTLYPNIGQAFHADNYFWSRPSAVNYNATSAGGSNKGPTNPEYLKMVGARIDTFLKHNPEITRAEIPSDMITASGSGLDPDISVQAARVQAPRIAKARNIEESTVNELIEKNIQKPMLNLFGTEKINVLILNIELDKLSIVIQ